MKHVLVTNDFPPKVGGIQSYLWELWRRLPSSSFAVLTTAHPDAEGFDAGQAFRIERSRASMLLPTPAMVHRARALATRVGAGLVVLDPALPVGLIGPRLGLPYGVVLHGAEVSVPGRLPGLGRGLAHVVANADFAITGGSWPETEARRVAGPAMPPVVTITPGVDQDRFRPLGPSQRSAVRQRHGLPARGRLVLSVSRLVPRKGMTTIVAAAARLAPSRPDLTVAIVGTGRERARLEGQVAASGAPVRLLGHVPDAELAGLYGAADVFAMLCRTRWGGLEQEGFGIVFLEAAACGVPQVAGLSGGAAEAVAHGESGLVVDRPTDAGAVATALARLLDDEELRARLGRGARARVESRFTYDALSARLAQALQV